MQEPISAFVRAMTLDKTLKEWEMGGNGEGVDVVRWLVLTHGVTVLELVPNCRSVLQSPLEWV